MTFKHSLFLPTLFFCFLVCSFSLAQSKLSGKSFLVCGDSKVLLVDYAKSKEGTPSVIWTWDASKAADLPEDYKRRFQTMDDCKVVDKGKSELVSSSSGAIALLDSKSRKVLFLATVPNAHSIELLPGNLIAAAASTNKTGNKIMLFDAGESEKLLAEDSLYSAHGTVWHEPCQRL